MRTDQADIAVPVQEGGEIKVTGQVVRITVAEIETELEMDLDHEIEVEVSKYPVLEASQVDVVDAT